ncbi:hypothetical protein J41TS12_10600 [Paenibacillus antibioticophila]|uniref:Uncharacterized protein n=1 Tax=Paenibacillus antibioticophila TaxID=1274374 RepID=A0A919XNT9_9BACL|nr:hypothetical protein [Paenibacillus antibioticophila]GIO36199.1 hypothetical protein J41TS12_10600 [Paenibacillus antibioticophila]
MADNKEFYRLDLVIGTDGVEDTEKTIKAMDKLLEQTQRRAAALGKTKITPSVSLQDKATSSADKVTRTLDKVDRKRAKPEARLIDKVSGTASKLTTTLNNMARKPFNLIIRAKDMATGVIKKVMGALTSPLAMLGVGGGVAGTTAVGLDMVMQEQGITSAFKVMLGSADAAAQRVQELTTFAGQTPYKREDIYEASRVLQVFTGNALSTGDGLKMVGDIAAGTKQEFGDVALWVGRLYDAMKSGRPVGEMTSRLQEMGAIGGDARAGIEALADSGKDISKTWPLVTQAFGKFDGMMEDMSGNLQNLLLGTKSFFTQNVIKRWGYGVESALAPVLKKFREWRGENKDTIASIGEWFEAAGKNVTTFVLDKGQRAFKVLSDLANDPAFKDADFFGKAAIAWDRIITQPFSEWWSSSGEQKIADMSSKIGTALGGGLKGFILGALGLFDKSDTGEESVYVSAGRTAGEAFFTSFLDALDPGEILKKLGNVALDANTGVFTDPSVGNIVKAVGVDLAAIAGGTWLYNTFLKGPVKVGQKVTGWFGSGSKAAAAAGAATKAGEVATKVATGVTGSAAASALEGSAEGLSRTATYGKSASWLSKAGKVLGPLSTIFTFDMVDKWAFEAGDWLFGHEQGSERSQPGVFKNPFKTETWEDDRPGAIKRFGDWIRQEHAAYQNRNELKSQWDTYYDLQKRAEEQRAKGETGPLFTSPSYMGPVGVSYNTDGSVRTVDDVKISEEQLARMERQLSEIKQEVSVTVNMPAGLVNLTVQKDDFDYETVVNMVGQRTRDALRAAQQNIK